MGKRTTKPVPAAPSEASVWALCADPGGTVALVVSGALDGRLEALADAAARWAVSPVRRACWARLAELASEDPDDG